MAHPSMDVSTRDAMARTGSNSGVIRRSSTTHQWLMSAVSRRPGNSSRKEVIVQGLKKLRERWVSKLTGSGHDAASSRARLQK